MTASLAGPQPKDRARRLTSTGHTPNSQHGIAVCGSIAHSARRSRLTAARRAKRRARAVANTPSKAYLALAAHTGSRVFNAPRSREHSAADQLAQWIHATSFGAHNIHLDTCKPGAAAPLGAHGLCIHTTIGRALVVADPAASWQRDISAHRRHRGRGGFARRRGIALNSLAGSPLSIRAASAAYVAASRFGVRAHPPGALPHASRSRPEMQSSVTVYSSTG